MNEEFADIVGRGSIELAEPQPVGEGAGPELPGVILDFDRRSWARLRQLIDALNQMVDDAASPPRDATPLEILPIALSDNAEAEEEA